MRRWENLVEGYLRYCEVQGLSEGTRRSREAELARLGRWLRRRRPRPTLEQVDTDMVVAYLRSRSAFRAKSTIAGTTSHVRMMGEYLVREGIWKSNPLRWLRGPKMNNRSRLPRRISKEHLKALWEEAVKKREGFARAQVMAILAVLYGTGIRRGELERLDVSDWSRDEGTLLVDGRKTGEERKSAVPGSVARCLEAYLPHRHNVLEKAGRLEEAALFLNRKGLRLSGERVGVMIHGLARRAGVPLVSVHQFRHTCASDLIEEGLTLPQVQQVLGHKAITSTMWYLSLSDPDLRRAILKHPLNEILAEESGGVEAKLVATAVAASESPVEAAVSESGGGHG